MFRTTTVVTHGLDVKLIDVEVGISAGLPEVQIVGLPSAAVRESRARVKQAMRASGLPFPKTRVTINLAPAHVRKTGGHVDLAIAMAILGAMGVVGELPSAVVWYGELSLSGEVRPVPGAVLVGSKIVQQKRALVVSEGNATDAALVPGLRVHAVASLGDLVTSLQKGELPTVQQKTQEAASSPPKPITDLLSRIKGQEMAKRVLEIAAAGGHHVLLVGPPGAGKTMLARALGDLLPPLSQEEALEVASIQSYFGARIPKLSTLSRLERPVRSPHHSASVAALIGGGVPITPGELTRAHRGVLFLDEFSEFAPRVLEALRQPLEEGTVQITRSAEQVSFPANVVFVAAMNPCACGFDDNDETTVCVCSEAQKERYKRVLSGPIADRIDLRIPIPRISSAEYLASVEPEGQSNEVTISEVQRRKRIQQARERQQKRYRSVDITTNAEVRESDREKHKEDFFLSASVRTLFEQSAEQWHLSARGMSRVLNVARTIADLEEEDQLREAHIAEALQYRL